MRGRTIDKKAIAEDERENISDGVELLLGWLVKLDVWASYLPGPNALSETLRQHVNMSQFEHMRSKTGGCQCLLVMPGKTRLCVFVFVFHDWNVTS